jgi:hypothetical protein
VPSSFALYLRLNGFFSFEWLFIYFREQFQISGIRTTIPQSIKNINLSVLEYDIKFNFRNIRTKQQHYLHSSPKIQNWSRSGICNKATERAEVFWLEEAT